MPTISTRDGTQIYYKDWGSGQPVVFSHGWPLNSDAWESQMYAVASAGFRAIGHDRRGHGRSSQPWNGNDMDTYADDLAELIEALDLRDVVLIGHSTGGGEVTRYVGRYGTDRVAKVVLVGAVPPLMVQTPENPGPRLYSSAQCRHSWCRLRKILAAFRSACSTDCARRHLRIDRNFIGTWPPGRFSDSIVRELMSHPERSRASGIKA